MPNIEFFTGFEGCGNTADCRVMVDFMNADYTSTVYDATRGYEGSKCVKAYGTAAVFGYLYQNCTPAKTKCVGWHVRGLRNDGLNNPGDTGRVTLQCYQELAGGGTVRNEIIIQNETTGVAVYKITHSVPSTTATMIAQCTTTIPGGPEIDGYAPIHHVEVKLVSHATEGYVGIKLDGIMILEASNLNTGGEDFYRFKWGHGQYDVPTYSSTYSMCSWDNLFIADDWVGEMRSVMLKPAVDDAVQFTPDTGTDNFDRIDDTAPDGDVSYVESNQVFNKDIYEFEDLPLGLIPMVATYVVNARKTDVGPRTLSMRAVQDATTYNLEERPLAIEYPLTHFAGLIDTLTRCPDGTVWDIDNLNAVKWGFEITV